MENFSFSGSERGFNVFWNVPTENCRKHGIDFEPLIQTYKMISNKNDTFRGGNVTIIYNPGYFPTVKKVRTVLLPPPLSLSLYLSLTHSFSF